MFTVLCNCSVFTVYWFILKSVLCCILKKSFTITSLLFTVQGSLFNVYYLLLLFTVFYLNFTGFFSLRYLLLGFYCLPLATYSFFVGSIGVLGTEYHRGENSHIKQQKKRNNELSGFCWICKVKEIFTIYLSLSLSVKYHPTHSRQNLIFFTLSKLKGQQYSPKGVQFLVRPKSRQSSISNKIQ